MEKEDALKAGHWVEPFRGMQLCGAATGMKNAMAVRSAVEASDTISIAICFVAPRDLNTNEGFQNAQWVPKYPTTPREDARALPYRSSLGGC